MRLGRTGKVTMRVDCVVHTIDIVLAYHGYPVTKERKYVIVLCGTVVKQ